ncbi:[acyl-carrier-protein] S-malonyltransferase [Sorochytrium milnesiophthora]
MLRLRARLSQLFVGMGKDLYTQYACARRVFDQADEALQQKLSTLMFEGPPAELTKTENAQPAILTASAALMEVYKETTGRTVAQQCKYLLGHSLGEYTALYAADSIALGDAVKLVRKRGLAMRDAVSLIKGDTSMMALIIQPTQLDKIEAALADIRSGLGSDAVVELANINSSFQVVVSGDRQSVQAACQELEARHIAARAVELPVSAPFHCSLMRPAAQAMERQLQSVQFATPKPPVISNYTATPFMLCKNKIPDASAIPSLLVNQIEHSVQWHKSIHYCFNNGVNQFLVFGPNKVLGNLLKKDSPRTTLQCYTKASDFCATASHQQQSK